MLIVSVQALVCILQCNMLTVVACHMSHVTTFFMRESQLLYMEGGDIKQKIDNFQSQVTDV